MWQEIAVVLIVSAAVLFVLRRFGLIARRRRRERVSFVPLASLRKPPRADGGDHPPRCH
jgi:hypothetical protein